MDTELRFHIASYIDDLVRSGVERTEAQRRARLEFGTVEATKDECRQAWGLQRMDEIRADVRLAFRAFRANPGFTAVAVLSLALGIGANTAIVGVTDAVMLRELPVREPGRLVFVRTAGTVSDGPPYPYFELLRDQARSYEAVAAFSASNMELVIDGRREQLRGVWVSGNLYEMLGVAPVMGRRLTAADDQTPGKGGPDGAVAVISRAYWQQRFGGDPGIIGRVISAVRGRRNDCRDHAIGNHVGGTGASHRHGSSHDAFRSGEDAGPVGIVVGNDRAAQTRCERGTGPRGSQRPVQGVHDGRTGPAGGKKAAVRSRGGEFRRQGIGRPADAVFATADGVVGLGRPGIAGGLRKRGEPDAGAGGGASKGLGSPPGDWRGTRAADPADSDGGAVAGGRGRSAGGSVCTPGRDRAGCVFGGGAETRSSSTCR